MTAATSPAVISVRPAPRREPPFDDERPERHLSLVGPHDQRLPFATAARIGEAVALRRPGWAGLPDPQAFSRRLLVGVFEALAGRRPLRQLAPHLSPRVYAGLLADVDRQNRTGAPTPAVRSVRAACPAEAVAELAVVIEVGPRCRAVAMRLEAHERRWRCVRLQLG